MIAKVKTIGYLLLPDFHLLDLAGSTDVFQAANSLINPYSKKQTGIYKMITISRTTNRTLACSAGIEITCDYTISSFNQNIDTLLIVGSKNDLNQQYSSTLIHWLKGYSTKPTRIGSICIGIFLLATA